MPILKTVKQIITRVSLIFAISMFLVSATTTQEAFSDIVVASHVGSTDPLLQGWGTVGSAISVNAGPVTDAGTEAWFVDDNSEALDTILWYEKSLSAASVVAGNINGWTLTGSIRVASDENLDFGGSPFFAYRDGSTSWQVHLGLNANGDTTVELFDLASPGNGPTFSLPGNSNYSTYSLVYNPSEGNADFFIDGTQVFSDWEGFAFGGSGVLWGTGSSIDSGQGNFSQVTFAVAVPEPSVLAPSLAMLSILSIRKRNSQICR